MLSVGIIGLPNVGKSTLFNALTAGAAEVSNYPFTTIEANVGVVPVPDERLQELARVLEPEETTPCFIRFVDIAGLVEGASRGEGLGNRFLAAIREVDAIAHVVRCFETADVAHVRGEIDPLHDAEIVETELVLSDLELLARAREKREREWKADPKAHAAERQVWEGYREALEAGRSLRGLQLDDGEREELDRLGLLTVKPLLYVANVGEESAGGGDARARELREQLGEGEAVEVVEVCAALEGELAQLEPEERAAFMTELGVAESGLARLVHASFELLGLVRFYTVVHGKLRAWEIERGTRAQDAAGKIHSDMAEGFIRARVARHEDVLEAGGTAELQKLGRLRTEGKDYEVRDGDVVEFLFR